MGYFFIKNAILEKLYRDKRTLLRDLNAVKCRSPAQLIKKLIPWNQRWSVRGQTMEQGTGTDEASIISPCS